MKCENCGEQITGTEKFCSHCGKPIQLRVISQLQKNIPKHHKRFPTVLASIAALLCICGICCFWFLHVNHQAQDYIGTEKGVALTEEEAERILLSDITDEDWAVFDESNEVLSQIVSQYSNENGYIDTDDTESVINAVAAKVDELYEDGIVTFYYCDEDGVSFEYANGLTAFYQPEAEGYASGGDEISILTFSPFENEDNWNTSYIAGTFIDDSLDIDTFSWNANEDVTIGLLKNLSSNVFFLWNGHGNYVHIWGYQLSVLQTGQASTDRTDIDDLSSKEVTVKIAAILWFENTAYETTDKWCITPFFVENRLSMDQGMSYLLACQSGRDDRLAAAFTNIGAEVSFVHVGTENVRKWYADKMMISIIAYMAGGIDGIYHTADESLELANSYWKQWFIDNGGQTATINGEDIHYDTLNDYIENAQGGTHVEVQGTGIYTLCACIRGTVSFGNDMTEEEIADIMETLSVELETEDGEFVMSTTLSSGEFYFNDLEPGNYYVSLYQNGKMVSCKQEVIVQAHRYTPITLLYSALVPLEGYVYNTAGEPLSGVSVAAELSLSPELYSSNTLTDSDGYYRIEVFGINEYTLSYDLDGYNAVINNFNVTSEMFSNAQDGTATQLDDVILLLGGNCGENLFWKIDSSGTLVISGVGDMESHGYHREWPNTITAVIVEEGVTSIGAYSFYDFNNLISVTLPDSLTRIEEYAFGWCDNLAEITIPGSVTYIGEAAFKDCHSLSDVTILGNVTTIEGLTFSNCTSLTQFSFPNGVTTIEGNSFFRCTSLETVTIPNSVSYIASGAFNDCSALTDVYYEGSEAEWDTLTEDWRIHLVTYPNDCLKNATVHCMGE